MKKGNIILLNGVSSSGKSTLAKELAFHLEGFFHVSIDEYDGFIEKTENRKSGHLIPVSTETFFHRTLAMFSDLGVNVIADQVLHDTATTQDCMEVLKSYPVLFVGVHCPLHELQRREADRRDRTLGLAKKQLDVTHQNHKLYHVEVDTFESTITQCAKKIMETLYARQDLETWLDLHDEPSVNK